MIAPFVAFAVATGLGLILTPFVREIAIRYGALDHARGTRKVHTIAVPRLGGIAIVLAFFATVAVVVMSSGEVRMLFATDVRYLFLLVGAAAIALLGVYDDLRGADAKLKFVVQFAVAGLMYFGGYRIDFIELPAVGTIHLGAFGLPLTLLWITGIINAINLIDGLDGLAGGVVLTATAATAFVALQRGETTLLIVVLAAMAGAVIAFLVFNRFPASIFMGDSGSLFLGFLLATASIQANQKSSLGVALFVPILALGLPILDTLLAIARRMFRGAPLFSADRHHIHHRILALGMSQRQAVAILHVVSAALALVACLMTLASRTQALVIFGVVALGTGLLLTRLGYFGTDAAREAVEARRRNARRRAELKAISSRLNNALGYAEIWEVVKEVAGVLSADAVSLRIVGGAFHQHPPEPSPSNLQTIAFHLQSSGVHAGWLEFGWMPRDAAIDRDQEIVVEEFCRALVRSVRRVVPVTGRRHTSQVKAGA